LHQIISYSCKFSFQEEATKLEEFELAKQKRSKKEEIKSVEEKSTLHGK
jgi:pre-mRNA-processing factor 17